MIKALKYILPAMIMIACGSEVKTDETEATSETYPKVNEPKRDYAGFIALFPEQTLPYSLDRNSIENCNNGQFCGEEILNTETKQNSIPAMQLEHLTLSSSLNREHQTFMDWLEYTRPVLGDILDQAMPGFRFEQGNHTFVTLYTCSSKPDQESSYLDVWIAKFNSEYALIDFKKLGSMGASSYVDEGEEEGAKYSITNTDYEYFSAEFTATHCNITLKRWNTRKGQDWRVDQNLKVDDSTTMNDVNLIYQY